jgi:hypothetical protein
VVTEAKRRPRLPDPDAGGADVGTGPGDVTTSVRAPDVLPASGGWTRPVFVRRLEGAFPKAVMVLFGLVAFVVRRQLVDYALPLFALPAVAVAAVLMRRADEQAEEVLSEFETEGHARSPTRRPGVHRWTAEQAVPAASAALITLLFHYALWSPPYLVKWNGSAYVVTAGGCPRSVPGSLAHILDFRWVVRLADVPCPAAPLGHAAYPVYVLFLACAATCGFLAGRTVLIVWRISRIGRSGLITVRPGHPDRSGGLHALGELTVNCAMVLVTPSLYLGPWCLILFRLELRQRDRLGAVDPRTHAVFQHLWVFLAISLLWMVFMFWAPLSGIHRKMVAERRRSRDELARLGDEIAAVRQELIRHGAGLETPQVEEGTASSPAWRSCTAGAATSPSGPSTGATWPGSPPFSSRRYSAFWSP